MQKGRLKKLRDHQYLGKAARKENKRKMIFKKSFGKEAKEFKYILQEL